MQCSGGEYITVQSRWVQCSTVEVSTVQYYGGKIQSRPVHTTDSHWVMMGRCQGVPSSIIHTYTFMVVLTMWNVQRWREKKFKRTSNARVNFFLALVKYFPNFTLFCCENELCCAFALLGVILMDFNLVNFTITLNRETNKFNYIILASMDRWHSFFAHTCCQIHFTLFCRTFTFVKIYAVSWVK